MKHCSTLTLSLLLGSCSLGAWAQSTATLSGTLTDPSGAVVPSARVTIHSLATGADRVIDTDSAGIYIVPSLQPGDYSVRAIAEGFSAYTVQKVTLDVDQKVTVDMHLALVSSGETVQVESTASQIESQTMTVGQVIDRQTVQEIPLNGRHFLDLTVLTPGGVVAPTAGSLTGASRGLGANSFITAGNREDSVNFQINGINLNDMSQNQITFQPSINTTSEFKINNSTFSAEYGRSSGSIVNVSTRSGTNQFHGEVFDYFRNEALDARNYFNRSTSPATGLPLAGVLGAKAPLKRNNFGASVGGPIWRNHTFFFASYEGLRQHQGILQNSPVLSLAERAAVANAGMPAANALLAAIPLPNSGNNYVAFTPGPVSIDQYTGDVLHQFSANDQLHGFYAFQKDVRTEPNLQGDTVPGFGDHRNSHRQVLTLNETHVFSPSLVNEGRVGFNRIGIVFTPNTLDNPASFGIGDGLNANVGLPQTTLSDRGLVFGGPSGFPQGRTDTLGVVSDAATWLKGKHTVKFGGEFRRFLGATFSGDPGTLTYSNLTQFEQDQASSFSIQPTTVSDRIYVSAAAGFIQDNFKLTPKLTLEYGARFEWNGTPVEGANRFAVFNPSALTLTQVGTNGLGRAPYSQNYNFEPRLGFAYDLFGTGKSVVRGGYAIMADQPVSGVINGLTANPPFSSTVSFNGSTATPTIPVASLFTSAAAAGLALGNVNPNFKAAYMETYNVNVQQALPFAMVASVGYYGSVGRHLRIATNENQPTGAAQVRPYLALASASPVDPGKSINSNITEANSIGVSSYNALWATLTKNMSHGLQFNGTYQWAKSLDINSLGSQGGLNLEDSNNPSLNYGLSDFDVRHHFAGTAIYSLPFKRNRLVSGYQLSSIIQYQTGNPINITSNSSTFNGLTGRAIVRPNQLAPIVTQKIQQAGATNVSFIQSTQICNLNNVTPGCVFQVVGTGPSAASTTTYTGLGDMHRNSVTGPGFADVDLSAEKETRVLEGLSFKLRVDAFDILNHPNFGQPSGNVQSSTFGQITSTRFATSDGGSSRQLQISGKFVF
jgi:Carboxypeptidase regulatory-like domain